MIETKVVIQITTYTNCTQVLYCGCCSFCKELDFLPIHRQVSQISKELLDFDEACLFIHWLSLQTKWTLFIFMMYVSMTLVVEY